MPGLYPTAGLVAEAWAADVIDPARLGLVLPAKDSWAGREGYFVTRRVMPGSVSHPDQPIALPVVTFDIWAANLNSTKPLWATAAVIAGMLHERTFTPVATPELTMRKPGYRAVNLLEAQCVSEPSEVPEDPSGYAHIALDVAFDYAVLP
jgi:hypothetical protein